ncbi:MAG: hypothetical protein H6700_02390 [Myxococcales bacterium]|nr:hypothetical protein [Myxococcales bacterium]
MSSVPASGPSSAGKPLASNSAEVDWIGGRLSMWPSAPSSYETSTR